MAANNYFNANNMEAVVFDEDKNEVKVSRPNARELVASGKYFWKVEDVGRERIESDGPADPQSAMLTIYDINSEPMVVSRANARELVMSGKYTWATAHADEGVKEIEAPREDEEEVANTAVEKTEDPLDPNKDPLSEIAERVTGEANVEAYLATFSEDNLRLMLGERYGEKVPHRTSKDTIITKIVELEEDALRAE